MKSCRHCGGFSDGHSECPPCRANRELRETAEEVMRDIFFWSANRDIDYDVMEERYVPVEPENVLQFHAHGKDFYACPTCTGNTNALRGSCKKCYGKSDDGKMEKREKAQEYREWRKARSTVSFFCDACDETIEGRADSSAVIAFMESEITEDECRKKIQTAHDRHSHTNYDDIRHEKYQKNRRAGMDWEESHHEARQEARKEIRKIEKEE